MLAVLASLVWAGDPARDWGTLYDARLVVVADGTPAVAAELYAELLEDRAPSDPLYASCAFWLGHAQLRSFDVEGALGSLAVAAADPRFREPALRLVEEASLRLGTITSLPASWSFEAGPFPAVRGSAGVGRGETGVVRERERTTFAWGTAVRPGEPDGLSLRFSVSAPMKAAALSIQSRALDAVVRLVAVDADGNRWGAPEVSLPSGEWVEVKASLADFAPIDAPVGAPRLGRVVDLRIEDLTGERTSARGENTLLIDDVSVI